MSLPDLSGMSTPDFNPYPDEMVKIAAVIAKLSNAFDFTNLNDTNRAIFNIAANEEFAAIGMIVRIEWKQIYKADGTPTGVFLPGIEPCGRTKPETETDHDRVKWGVAKGLADGQPGYIREDGSKREDPIKRDIF